MTPTSTAIYQIVIIAPRKAAYAATLRSTLKTACSELGLKPAVLRFSDERSLDRIEPSLPVAAVYFGGSPPSTAEEAAVVRLCGDDVWMLPVVPTLKNFTKQVPAPLHVLNGVALNQADPALAAVANCVLEQLGLVRRERMVFISYKRTEARHAALSIYHGLDERSWGVFLDTHSIGPGVDFQNTLWDKMANADVLLLLDSPGVISSCYVQQELAHAHDLGMGVLQLIWPTQTRTPGTEFCEPEYLRAADFAGSFSRDGGARIRAGALRRILASVERVRGKALAARRDRLVREFCASAVASGKSAIVQPLGEIEVHGLRRGTRCMIPVVGHPNSQHLHDASDRANKKRERLMVLYDAAGSLPSRLRHLRWLNRHLPIQTLPVHESYNWLRTA